MLEAEYFGKLSLAYLVMDFANGFRVKIANEVTYKRCVLRLVRDQGSKLTGATE